MPQANSKNDEVKYSRINFPTLFLLGIFILFIAAVAYYLTLLIVRGEMNPSLANRRWLKLVPEVQRGSASSTSGSPTKIVQPITARVGILVSEYSRQKSPVDPALPFPEARFKKGWVDRQSEIAGVIADNIKEWLNLYQKENIQFDTILDTEIESGKTNYDVIILPYNPYLSDLEIDRITDFLSQGGGLIAVGDCGQMDETGKIRNISFLNRILGIAKVSDCLSNRPFVEANRPRFSGKTRLGRQGGDVLPAPSSLYVPLTLKSNSPLTIDILLGAKLGSTTEYGCIRANIIENRTIQDGYWYTPEFNPGIPLEEIKNSTGLCHGIYNQGRFVWLGFTINSVTGDDFSQNTNQKLLRNALLWLTQKPLAKIGPWPLDFTGAAVINGDIEQNFSNVANVVKILEEKKVNGSFFLLSSLAESNSDLVKMLAKNGEIGLHGNTHIEFKDQPYEVQFEELEKSKRSLERISRQRIIGFRPPYGSYDDNTIRALTKAGLNYLVCGIIEGTNLGPNFIPYLDDFIIIPKPNKDDYDLFYRDSITKPEAVFNELKDEFDRIDDLGGFYVLTFHSQILAVDTNCRVIAEMIDYMKGKKVWITTWQELTDWWRKTRELDLELEAKGSNECLITLNNYGEKAIENFKVQIFPPTIGSNLQIKSNFKERLNWRFDNEHSSYDILIKKLEPKTVRQLTCKFGS